MNSDQLKKREFPGTISWNECFKDMDDDQIASHIERCSRMKRCANSWSCMQFCDEIRMKQVKQLASIEVVPMEVVTMEQCIAQLEEEKLNALDKKWKMDLQRKKCTTTLIHPGKMTMEDLDKRWKNPGVASPKIAFLL